MVVKVINIIKAKGFVNISGNPLLFCRGSLPIHNNGFAAFFDVTQEVGMNV